MWLFLVGLLKGVSVQAPASQPPWAEGEGQVGLQWPPWVHGGQGCLWHEKEVQEIIEALVKKPLRASLSDCNEIED